MIPLNSRNNDTYENSIQLINFKVYIENQKQIRRFQLPFQASLKDFQAAVLELLKDTIKEPENVEFKNMRYFDLEDYVRFSIPEEFEHAKDFIKLQDMQLKIKLDLLPKKNSSSPQKSSFPIDIHNVGQNLETVFGNVSTSIKSIFSSADNDTKKIIKSPQPKNIFPESSSNSSKKPSHPETFVFAPNDAGLYYENSHPMNFNWFSPNNQIPVPASQFQQQIVQKPEMSESDLMKMSEEQQIKYAIEQSLKKK